MATKAKRAQYECLECGTVHAKWLGQCTSCGEWNSLQEVSAQAAQLKEAAVGSTKPQGWLGPSSLPASLKNVEAGQMKRMRLGSDAYEYTGRELNNILGGGVVPGSLVLLGGDPGIGKSTMIMQLAHMLVEASKSGGAPGPVFYASGEETTAQLKMRAQRLGITDDEHANNNILLVNESNIEAILAHVQVLTPPPAAVIVDSIQTMFTEDNAGSMGNVVQVRECTARLLRMAKSMHIPTFIIGHVTKQGK